MKVCQAFKFKLKTDKQIEQKLKEYSGCTRFVWNKALALVKDRLYGKEIDKTVTEKIRFFDRYSAPNYLPNYYDLAKMLVFWKSTKEYEFLNNVPSQTLQQTLKNLQKAIDSAFTKGNGIGFPRFKRKGKSQNSIRYPQGFKIEGNRIFLPKIGWVKFFKSREITGTAKNVTVKQYADGWYISVVSEQEIDLKIPDYSNPVGIDAGVKKVLTLSNGVYFKPIDISKLERKLIKEQRKLSRKRHPTAENKSIKASKNFIKQKAKVAKIYKQITDKRLDYLHKITTAIAKNHGIIAVEDLKIKNMVKSAKGTLENPGHNVNAKSGLNKSILTQSWGTIFSLLEYKAAKFNKFFVKVAPNSTSQTCPVCGFKHEDNRQSQSEFECLKCHYKANADLTASVNVLQKALKELDITNEFALPQGLREVTPVEYAPHTMKQELVRKRNRKDKQVALREAV